MQISRLTITLIVASIITAVAMSGCSGSRRGGAASDTAGQTAAVAAAPEVPATPPRVPESGDSDYVFSGRTEVTEYVESGPKADRYQGGILPVIARETPEYAARLIPELARYDGFIVVDKAAMEVILYDREGHVKRQYGMACARNYGTKHKKADSRTPEGFFSVEGRYNSTEWLYTDDNGVQSKKKGQFGPRFIRIKIPTTSQIGIHGTCAPWSIGHRASHGCIRLTNENILELVELVTPGMPVIILPGKRDRAVNREEGYDIPYFPTNPKYAMSDSERKLKTADPEEIKARERDSLRNAEEEERKVAPDTVTPPAVETPAVPTPEPEAPEETDPALFE